MNTAPLEDIHYIGTSLVYFRPEVVLVLGILLLIVSGFFFKKNGVLSLFALVVFSGSLALSIWQFQRLDQPLEFFHGMLHLERFSCFFKILLSTGGLLTVLLSWIYFDTCPLDKPAGDLQRKFIPEYYALILSVVLGGHLLVMSKNLLMVFISLELVSISSYVLTGFLFDKKGTEGSLKYFLFGSTASAVMLYGFSILYGITGTLDFNSPAFFQALEHNAEPLLFIAGVMALTGFLYKIAAAPMHPWAPDVYEAAPMPVVAFFSVVPKIAGLGIMTCFIANLNFANSAQFDWQVILCAVVMLTLTVGNFSALLQKNPKRLMAYSSIAQSGFLLVGLCAFRGQGDKFMLFYSAIYLVANFLVFLYLQYFESKGFTTIASYQKSGFTYLWPAIALLIGMISLTGLPPTAGFTAKLFVFSALWESYQFYGKIILLWLLVIGLLNTVVALFYYLQIPYHAFIKSGESVHKTNIISDPNPLPTSGRQTFLWGNLLGLILVIVLLLIFFIPGVLMGWINKINFVL